MARLPPHLASSAPRAGRSQAGSVQHRPLPRAHAFDDPEISIEEKRNASAISTRGEDAGSRWLQRNDEGRALALGGGYDDSGSIPIQFERDLGIDLSRRDKEQRRWDAVHRNRDVVKDRRQRNYRRARRRRCQLGSEDRHDATRPHQCLKGRAVGDAAYRGLRRSGRSEHESERRRRQTACQDSGKRHVATLLRFDDAERMRPHS